MGAVPATPHLPANRAARCLHIGGAGWADREALHAETAPRPQPARNRNPAVRGAGVDLVDLARLSVAVRRSGDAFVRRVLTDSEHDLLGADPGASIDQFGSIFGAKESAVKVLHGLPPGASLQDIIVPALPRPGRGSVELILRGPAQDRAADRGIRMMLSSARVTDRVLLTWVLAVPTTQAIPTISGARA